MRGGISYPIFVCLCNFQQFPWLLLFYHKMGEIKNHIHCNWKLYNIVIYIISTLHALYNEIGLEFYLILVINLIEIQYFMD